MSLSTKKKVTIKDIANLTGFSISTVSKAFNESYEISEETKKKINEVAKTVGYRPNKAALSLRSGKNFIIAVVIPSMEDPFYARVFNGIQNVITNTNYSVITCITRESLEEEIKRIDKVFNQVDAFIIAASEETLAQREFKHLQSIQNANKPLVIIDRNVESLACNKVLSSSRVAVRDITEKAFGKGYKKIVLISCVENVNNKWKKKGFLEAEPNNFDNKFILNSNKIAIEKDLSALIEKENIDCILAIEEDASFAALRVAEKLQKKVPNDIAIIGYMSEKIAENLNIPLTTINQHRKTMGEEAMNLILEILDAKRTPSFKEIRIKSTLMQRKTFL